MSYLSSITLSFLLACSAPLGAANIPSSCVARNLDFGQSAVGWVHQPLSTLKRDTVYLAADYRHAFGAAPGLVLGVAVMIDTGNTGTQVIGEYADIRLDCAGSES